MTAAPDTEGTLASGPLTGFEAVKRAVAAADAARRVTKPATTNSAVPDSPSATESTHGSTADTPENIANQPVARGDVRVIEPLPWLEGLRRLAIVRRVDAEHNRADMMLAHPWPELVTDTDAVIASDASGLPHPLVVECYVRGPVWLLQVRERVGFLPESILQAIGAVVVDGRPEVEGVRTGLPLAGPSDPRWRFKEDEVLAWGTLTDDCASALLEGDDPWQLEPERLQPHTYVRASDPATPSPDHLRLEETIHLIATHDVTVEFQDLDPATFDPDQWAEYLGRDLGMTALAALQPTLLNAFSRAGTQILQKAA